MPRVGFRPINTSLIKGDTGTHVFHSVDPDLVARRVFAGIGKSPKIAANFVEGLAIWIGEPGDDEEFAEAKTALTSKLSESLPAAYEDEEPIREYPPLPIVTVEATPAADPRKWVLTWSASAQDGIVRTELSTEPYETPVADATPYELALLACDVELTDETIARLAATPVQPAPIETPSLPDGPASGSATFNVNEPMGVRAAVVRGSYSVSVQSPVLNPFVDRDEEIAVASLDELAALEPDSIAVSYEYGDPRQRVSVLLVNGPFDAASLLAAVNDWRETQKPPDGEMIFDVTAGRLRLRRVVLR